MLFIFHRRPQSEAALNPESTALPQIRTEASSLRLPVQSLFYAYGQECLRARQKRLMALEMAIAEASREASAAALRLMSLDVHSNPDTEYITPEVCHEHTAIRT